MATSYTIGNKFIFLTCALLALAACAPANDPDPRCRWPGFRCAMGGPPMSAATVPPVTVDNPFRCPRRASPVIEYTDRYQALGLPQPDPETMCHGPCEGTGVYPVRRGDWTEDERAAWEDAERASPNEPGDEWHFIRCSDCGGTGKRT
jgi:hypothetical protein